LSDYSLRGWRILDRWAFNRPDALRHLEASGEILFLERLLIQQRIEQDAVNDQAGDLPEIEALRLANVRTELT
jgi:hypothetical protein